MIDFQGLNDGRIPGTTSVLVALKIYDENIIPKIYSINYAKGGYQIRYKGNTRALPYGEIQLCGLKAIIKTPEPIIRRIKKQTGELHLSGIPMEIPLKETVSWFEEKFGIKVDMSRLGVVPGFDIYNETINFEMERAKLCTIKSANFLHGFLTTTWYKGCIYNRQCNKCGETGHTPNKCTNDINTTIVTNVQEKEITISEQSVLAIKSNKEEINPTGDNNDITQIKENLEQQKENNLTHQQAMTPKGNTKKNKKSQQPENQDISNITENKDSVNRKTTQQENPKSDSGKNLQQPEQKDAKRKTTRQENPISEECMTAKQKLTKKHLQPLEDYMAAERSFINKRIVRRKEKRRKMREDEQSMEEKSLQYDEHLEGWI
ncbi:hypothetical protein ACJMK2_002602 [Sinanodonta woodiana]|uniref:CCHC-type domain-containing protein n=1 Tax=Sinanodonta woodiana TaxID=1069815 RepID=A0ABD3XYZ6_SINWO